MAACGKGIVRAFYVAPRFRTQVGAEDAMEAADAT